MELEWVTGISMGIMGRDQNHSWDDRVGMGMQTRIMKLGLEPGLPWR